MNIKSVIMHTLWETLFISKIVFGKNNLFFKEKGQRVFSAAPLDNEAIVCVCYTIKNNYFINAIFFVIVFEPFDSVYK